MRSWLALVLGPSIALAVQSVLFALVTPSCARQSRLELHVAAAVGLVAVLVLAVLAFSEVALRRAEPGGADSDEGDPGTSRRFLAVVATAVSALSGLVILAMWFGLFVLSPCDPWP
jgi:hypothetical protein